MKRIQGAGVRRRTARGAAVAAAVLMGGMIPSAQAAPGVLEIDADLAYTCDLPSGEQPVKAGVRARVAEAVRAGQAVQPEDVVTEVTLPEGVVAELTAAGAATVSAETRLTVDLAQNGGHAEAEWVGAGAESAPVPETGGLTLNTSGGVPYVKPGAPGDLSFAAAGLSVVLTPRTAEGAPAEPRSLALECVLDADQEASLATVGVAADEEDGTGSEPSPSASLPGGTAEWGDTGRPEVGKRAEEPAAADAPPCVGDPDDPFNMVAYVTGYANVTKLDGATRFPVACGQITQGETRPDFSDPGYMHMYQDSTVVLDYQGKPQLPPAEGTFLTFGFMPTTATLEMTQIPPGTRDDGSLTPNVKSDLAIKMSDFSSRNTTVITLDLMLRLHDVEVNGVPLDVGDDCRTSKPFTLTLNGLGTYGADGVLDGYTLGQGGPVTGSVTLPPFSGCGVDEDLDNLFTASLSGSPGYVKQVQGAPCAAAQGDRAVCTPENQPVDVPKAAR